MSGMGKQVMADLLRRHEATEATLAKFRGKAWSWESGITCAHLMRFHLLKMGHRLEPMPRLRSLVAARRALAARGCANMGELVGKHLGLPPIAPAEMLMGDLATFASSDGLGALMVCAGPLKLFGWREDVPELVVLDVELGEIQQAWRA
jgi:hypothetical protein